MMPCLVALDFDHTIVDKNSDIVVRDLLPPGKLTPDVKKLYTSNGWIAYMQRIFEILHKEGFTREDLQSAIKGIPVTPGIDHLLSEIKQLGCEIIIISDSNEEFINCWLENACLHHAVDKVFTNPSYYTSEGCLRIDMFHYQDWCTLSTKNLCKGHILETYIQQRDSEGTKFSSIAYVGDGNNDFCPCLRLSERDFVFPRNGFALLKKLKQISDEPNSEHTIRASVHPWDTGHDILKCLTKSLK